MLIIAIFFHYLFLGFEAHTLSFWDRQWLYFNYHPTNPFFPTSRSRLISVPFPKLGGVCGGNRPIRLLPNFNRIFIFFSCVIDQHSTNIDLSFHSASFSTSSTTFFFLKRPQARMSTILASFCIFLTLPRCHLLLIHHRKYCCLDPGLIHSHAAAPLPRTWPPEPCTARTEFPIPVHSPGLRVSSEQRADRTVSRRCHCRQWRFWSLRRLRRLADVLTRIRSGFGGRGHRCRRISCL